MPLEKWDPIDADTYGWKERWGAKFYWTPEHHRPEELEKLIHTYDTVAAEALDRLDQLVPPPYSGKSVDTNIREHNIEGAIKPDGEKKERRDLYELMAKYASEDEKIGRFWESVHTIPEWVDWEQIERGQKVFWRYGGPTLTTLTFMSLLGGMGSGRTVETLDRTGGFSAKVVKRRLLETTQHTLNVHKDLASIKPGGDGFVNSVQVRLLHATVRQRILAMAKERPDFYDVETYGVPVNDLDCIGTINTFSSTVVWLGLPRQGIYMRDGEIRDFIALWRYVAYIMGTPDECLATPKSAKIMMESLLASEINPTRSSGVLANNIITGMSGTPPTFSSPGFMAAQTYWLNGEQLSAALHIPKPAMWYNTLVLGQCMLFIIMAHLNRWFASLDEYNIKMLKKILYHIILHDKAKGGLGYTTRFNFKYVPHYDRMNTEQGVYDLPARSVLKPGAERTALIGLVMGTGLVSLGVIGTYRVGKWLSRSAMAIR